MMTREKALKALRERWSGIDKDIRKMPGGLDDILAALEGERPLARGFIDIDGPMEFAIYGDPLEVYPSRLVDTDLAVIILPAKEKVAR